jgi:hypothetical protein
LQGPSLDRVHAHGLKQDCLRPRPVGGGRGDEEPNLEKADLPLYAHFGRSANFGGFSEADVAAAQLIGLSSATSGP